MHDLQHLDSAVRLSSGRCLQSNHLHTLHVRRFEADLFEKFFHDRLQPARADILDAFIDAGSDGGDL